jgi:hypothetical protein
MKSFSTSTRSAATLLVGAAAAVIMSTPVQPAAAEEVGAQSHKRYLLNNTYHGAWQDDGVKGQVRNFTNKRIVVRDTTMDKSVEIWPGQTVIFYSDRDLGKFGNLSSGDGTWLEITDYNNPHARSEFRLCDAAMGRPDTLFWGPGRKVQTARESWKVNESHHELTPTHKHWIKREPDSWKDKHDTWNTSDWAAFTIHVDQI